MIKRIVEKLLQTTKEGLKDLFYFGPRISWEKTKWIMSDEEEKITVHRNSELLKYLEKRFSKLLNCYAAEPTDSHSSEGFIPKCYWTMWWQGEENMPEIIRRCMISKELSLGSHIIIVTKDNYREYLDIPMILEKKLEKKQIRLAHFADIIRIMLLEKYGGIWLDASILCMHNLPDAVFEQPFFSIRSAYDSHYVSEARWTTFAIGGTKGNVLFRFLKDFFLEYLETGKPFIDYFMFDCAIMLAYKNIPFVHEEVDLLPESKTDCYWLNEHLNDNVDNMLEELLNVYPLQKIGWQRYIDDLPGTGSVYEYVVQSQDIR